MNEIKTALVTGSTGFIGSHLVRRLVADGVQTYCLVRRGTLPGRRRELPHAAHIRLLPSIGSREIRRSLDGVQPDIVFHLASSGVLRGQDEPAEMVEANVNYMAHLLQAVAAAPPRLFLHTGSCSEYGSSPIPLTEDGRLSPQSVYGASKSAAYFCGRAMAAQLRIPFMTLRLFNVYGPGEAAQRLIPYLIDRLSQGEPAELTSGEQSRDLLYIDDVIDALQAAARIHPTPPCSEFNVCSGAPVTIRHVVELVAAELKAPPRLLKFGARPSRSDEPMSIVGDNTRFRNAAQWKPRRDLSEGIHDMVRVLTSPARIAA